MLKYPWACFHYPDPHPIDWPIPPRGAGHARGTAGAAKFSAYIIDLQQMLDALAAFPQLPPGRQTLECSVMDLADDIAYSLHDVMISSLGSAAVLSGLRRISIMGERTSRLR